MSKRKASYNLSLKMKTVEEKTKEAAAGEFS